MFQMIKIYDTNISVKYYKYIINWISSSKTFSKSKDQKSSEFLKKRLQCRVFPVPYNFQDISELLEKLF